MVVFAAGNGTTGFQGINNAIIGGCSALIVKKIVASGIRRVLPEDTIFKFYRLVAKENTYSTMFDS